MKELAKKANKTATFEPRNYVPSIEKKEFGRDPVSLNGVADTFVEKLGLEKKPVSEVILNIFFLFLFF